MTEEELIEQELKKKKTKKPKQEKSESQLVHEYVDKVIKGKASRGHTDSRFDYTKNENAVNKDLWLDTDFFFSIVFGSEAQKYDFLKGLQKLYKFEIEGFEESQVQIVNGYLLAKEMGIELKDEVALDYPLGPMDLRPFVLDDEE